MIKKLYFNIAKSNIKKNKNTFLPFLISSITMVAMFYMLYSIRLQTADNNFYGSVQMSALLRFGVWVTGILAVLILFYTNGFLIKRRKKELGLYSVLGLEKKHISFILFWEMMITGFASILLGLLVGMLLSKLMFLVLLNLLHLSVSFAFHISLQAAVVTIVLFLVSFVIIIIYNNIKVSFLKPVDLLHGSNAGESEPKTKLISSFIGVICLGIAYYLALTVQNPIQAINKFFIAVLLVILGTHQLFMAGSIAILKFLKRRKRFYYQKNHFITVSGMIYRMKQNATGLANICILSTAVLVVFSSTVSLYIGMENVMRTRYPSDVITNYVQEPRENQEDEKSYDRTLIGTVFEEHAEKHSVALEDIREYYSVAFFGKMDENIINIMDYMTMDHVVTVEVMMEEDFNRLYKGDAKQGIKLEDKDFGALYVGEKPLGYDSVVINGKEIAMLGGIEDYADAGIKKTEFDSYWGAILVIVPDYEQLVALSDEFNQGLEEREMSVRYNYECDLQGEQKAKEAFCTTLRAALNDAGVAQVGLVENIYTTRQEFLELYGSLLFIGIFIGMLFLIATVLIIYYKQISEGHEDRKRFEIMQKVGMSKKEVKSAINSQIRMVFFLPLGTAIVHIMFAFNIIKKLLAMLNLTDVKLFILCTIGTIGVFAAAYVFVYSLTAKTYYRIVNEAN